MAGIGPAPKDQSERRNKSAPQRGEWVDLEPLEQPVLPELPARADGEEWSDRTKLTWEAWRSDPVTGQYSPADVVYALDTILLYDGLTSANGANEVRLRMDGLGLTPKGKRDLRWRIVTQAPEAKKPARSSGRRGGGRRARLSVVE